MKTKISLVVFLIAFVLGFCGYLYVHEKENRPEIFNIDFVVSEEIATHPTILVDGIPAFVKGKQVTAISLTITRPITVSVDGQTKQIKLNRLSKDDIIQIHLIYNHKKQTYFLPTLPRQFPKLHVFKGTNILPKGYVLISFHGLKLKHPSYGVIVDMNGNIVYYRGNTNPSYSMFHLQKWVLENGKVRYSMHEQDEKSVNTSWVTGHHLILDSDFKLIDKVSILPTDTHGALLADEHEIIVLDDHHYIVIGYEEEKYENSDKIKVVHAIIQEQKEGRVLFDWTSKGKPEFVQMCYEKCPAFEKENADYLHLNAVTIDPRDGHLVVSSASAYNLFKLHRKTGDLLWVLGGKKNDFKMNHDDLFVRQHHPQITSDGQMLLFDNGVSSLDEETSEVFNIPSRFARIMLFDLDEKNKTVGKVSVKDLGFWVPYMGSVQLFKNGDLFVGCGSSDICSARLYNKKMAILWTLIAEAPYKMYRAYWVDKID